MADASAFEQPINQAEVTTLLSISGAAVIVAHRPQRRDRKAIARREAQPALAIRPRIAEKLVLEAGRQRDGR